MPELGGRTPLTLGEMPVLGRLARQGTVGAARTIPAGMPAGSDVGIMAILGADPRKHHRGRAPIEAAGLGVDLPGDRTVFRCNLVTVKDGIMVDFKGGDPDPERATAAITVLQRNLGGEVTFHAGLGYRNLMSAPAAWADSTSVAPHEIVGRRAVPPTGKAGTWLARLMEESRSVLGGNNQIWLWGQGRAMQLPRLPCRDGRLIGAVAVARGLGVLRGLAIMPVPGATGTCATSYEAKRDTAIGAFADGADLVVVHVAATDEAGHDGDVAAKVAALEHWDSRLLAGLVEYLDGTGPWRLLWVPDHATATRRRAHTATPVPYLRYDSAVPGPGGALAEEAVAGLRPEPAQTLMSQLLDRDTDGRVMREKV
jgi:2,3-bisphosphoglycerate-independent phosphoglycerate mutase